MKFLDASWENGNDELNSSSANVKSSDSELIALHFTFLLLVHPCISILFRSESLSFTTCVLR